MKEAKKNRGDLSFYAKDCKLQKRKSKEGDNRT